MASDLYRFLSLQDPARSSNRHRNSHTIFSGLGGRSHHGRGDERYIGRPSRLRLARGALVRGLPQRRELATVEGKATGIRLYFGFLGCSGYESDRRLGVGVGSGARGRDGETLDMCLTALGRRSRAQVFREGRETVGMRLTAHGRRGGSGPRHQGGTERHWACV